MSRDALGERSTRTSTAYGRPSTSPLAESARELARTTMAGRLRDAATTTRRGRRDDEGEDEYESATTTSETTSATASLIGSSVIEFGRERERERGREAVAISGQAERRERVV